MTNTKTKHPTPQLYGAFIQSIEGTLIQVTDYKKALQQAKDAVAWHEERKRIVCDYLHPDNRNVCYFPDAHKEWEHNLFQLEKLALSNPHIAD
ncbi:MAG: hypothetical protein Q8O88_03860 [bacterium]|nr:hypothetical protein [bacterium]